MQGEIIPIPQIDVSVRDATLADVAFIDQLQKLHGKQVGFMRTSWIEAKIKAGQVIVAVDSSRTPVGYCMGVDRYFKRDDVGIIHQMNVVPTKQRGFVGATLLRTMFERAAYGCRLFCCWCAQDIEANRFWESMGFVPLAYRAGSEKKRRVHIFWQKRIREGDNETPWWFPSQTTGGAINEDRLVLPIPPGKHWSDEMPVIVLPGEEPKQIEGPALRALEGPKEKRERKPAKQDRPAVRTLGAPRVVGVVPIPAQKKTEKPKREKTPKRKNDPKVIAAVRELKDRWLEHVNSGAAMIESSGKYDVARALPAMSLVESPVAPAPLLLPAAA